MRWYVPEEFPDINDFIGPDQLTSKSKMRIAYLNWLVLALLYLGKDLTQGFVTADNKQFMTHDNKRFKVSKE